MCHTKTVISISKGGGLGEEGQVGNYSTLPGSEVNSPPTATLNTDAPITSPLLSGKNEAGCGKSQILLHRGNQPIGVSINLKNKKCKQVLQKCKGKY